MSSGIYFRKPYFTRSPTYVERQPLAQFVVQGGVGTSGSVRRHLHEDQAQDALDRPVVAKTVTSYEMHAYSQLLHRPPSRHSDVSRFNLSSDDNRVCEWRARGERLNAAFALQRCTAPTAGAKARGVIAYNTRSPLVLIRSTTAAQRYVYDILYPHVLLLMQRFPGAIFQQDNDQPHTARVSQDCLRTVTTLPWPPRSPDLSPIEHI
ncbi:transposable element Tcb2 transposase [Trichonephila clavipes]|nr:transposable element Tcb2 transposase [Trichonephila clavipes]